MAIISATAAAAVTTGRLNSAADWASGLFSGNGPTPTEAEVVTADIFEHVRHAEIWEGQPTLYPPSRRYLLEHFSEYDPRKPHGSYLLPQEPVLSPGQLAVAMPIYAGNRVTVMGQVRIDSTEGYLPTVSHVWSHAGHKVPIPNAAFTAQIASPGGNRSPLVDVIYAAPASPPLAPGQWVAVVGVPIASGNVKLNVGGFVPAVYVVVGSIEPVRGPHSVLKSVRSLERKLRRPRKHCHKHPEAAICDYLRSTTGRA